MHSWYPPVLATTFAVVPTVVFAIVLTVLVGRVLWARARAIRDRRTALPIPDWAVALFGPEDAADLAACDVEAHTARLIAVQVRKLRRVSIVAIAAAASRDDAGFALGRGYGLDDSALDSAVASGLGGGVDPAVDPAIDAVIGSVVDPTDPGLDSDYRDLVIDFADGTRLRLFHVGRSGILALVRGLRVRGRMTLDALELRAGHVQCVLRRGNCRASLDAGGLELSRGRLGRR